MSFKDSSLFLKIWASYLGYTRCYSSKYIFSSIIKLSTGNGVFTNFFTFNYITMHIHFLCLLGIWHLYLIDFAPSSFFSSSLSEAGVVSLEGSNSSSNISRTCVMDEFSHFAREEGAGKLYWDGVLKRLGWGAKKIGMGC